MHPLSDRLLRWEFEKRIFISLSIVLVTCAVCAIDAFNRLNVAAYTAKALGYSTTAGTIVGYELAACAAAIATLLRMWAGSTLHSDRVMSFPVAAQQLIQQPPYTIIRNPIYLADLIAFAGFSCALTPPGLLMPALLYLHYRRLIRFEEQALRAQSGEIFEHYAVTVPRLFPDQRSFSALRDACSSFTLTRDGIRNNALYVLFVPGFIVAGFTQQFPHAVFIGLPAVADWAVRHTLIGLHSAINHRSAS